jgi:hypothetical protein
MFYSAPPLRRCVAIATPRLRSPALRTAIRDTNIMSIRTAIRDTNIMLIRTAIRDTNIMLIRAASARVSKIAEPR